MLLVKLLVFVLLVSVAVPMAPLAAECADAPGDVDHDGLCDALDPCAYGRPVNLREQALSLRRLGAPAGDDVMRLRGIVPLDERMIPDPTTTGLRVVVLDGLWQADDVVVDVAAPPGPGWRAHASGRSWSYRAPDRRTTGIARAVVRELAPNPAYVLPRQYAVTVYARRGAYTPTSDLESHLVSVAFAATGTTDRCADGYLSPWLIEVPGVPTSEAPAWQPSCRFDDEGHSLDCTSGPRVGPCRVSHPDDWVHCDVQNAAAAQERHRIATGTYYTGPCDMLPGFSASPDTACAAWGTAVDFEISAYSPYMTLASGCSWNSRDATRLVCS